MEERQGKHRVVADGSSGSVFEQRARFVPQYTLTLHRISNSRGAERSRPQRWQAQRDLLLGARLASFRLYRLRSTSQPGSEKERAISTVNFELAQLRGLTDAPRSP